MGKLDEMKAAIARGKAAKGAGAASPPAVRRQDKRYEAKGRLPPGSCQFQYWDGSAWHVLLAVPGNLKDGEELARVTRDIIRTLTREAGGVTKELKAPKLFAGLHAVDDLYRAAVAAEPTPGEDKPFDGATPRVSDTISHKGKGTHA